MSLLRRPSRRALVAVAGASVAAGLTLATDPAPPAAATEPQVSYAATSASWNRHISCKATVTTLATVLGGRKSAQGGASFVGGGFKPGIPNRRDATPPCSVNGTPTLVELHHVTMGSCAKINKDGDWTCVVTDPRKPKGLLNRIHIETGANVRAMGDWTIPPGGTPLDIQGFVFWDPDHVNAAFHDYTGWELHSFTAWRRART